MSRVVICGGGFGGVATAAALRRLGPPELEIAVVDRRSDFVMGLRKIWAALGIEAIEGGRRPLASIEGVRAVSGEILAIDVDARRVQLADEALDGDWLVIALGADQAMDGVTGLAEHAINVWSPEGASLAWPRVAAMRAGRLVVGVFGMPYSCPPAPYELALLARDRLPAEVEVGVFTPAPIALPVLGREESARIEAMLAERGIRLLLGRRAQEVRSDAVLFDDGSTLGHDLLLAVPPHRCPQLLLDAGLAEPGGWLTPDPLTLEMGQQRVSAIGDCTVTPLTNGMALPKAGALAQAQGEVVAARIAAELAGQPPEATFDGAGYCFVELGRGTAAQAGGRFFAEPPEVGISEPSTAGLAEKKKFERSRLEAWFGG